jgi:hypothetical protein
MATTEALRREAEPEDEATALRVFLDRVYRLSRDEKVHAAGDLIFDFVQSLL